MKEDKVGKTGMYGKFIYPFTVVCGGPEWKRLLERKMTIFNWNLRMLGVDSASPGGDPVVGC